ncbi:Hypothetical predicted protein [Paramuricea clavata]|uniref:Uncharacterized protein n=1 Tax=Paramuricea clavata TaxID=317549 RepID=A0A7D9D9L4_PARCT|nr:Hypothetical predicted protein [Paramuricea clavata]
MSSEESRSKSINKMSVIELKEYLANRGDGYVESLLTETLSNERLHLYMGKVKPAMKDKTDKGKSYYDCSFILEEDLLNTHGEDSPTNMPCIWTKKPTVDSRPCDVKDLLIAHCDLP